MRISSAGFSFLSFVIAICVAAGIWVAVAAAYENMRLARATDQVLSFVATAEDDAAKDATFARTANEDLITTLWRRGQIAGGDMQAPEIRNVWGGAVHLTVEEPLVMRLETDVPSRACHQLGLFFGDAAADIGLKTMRAREGQGSWRQFYSSTSGAKSVSDAEVIAACGNTDVPTTLALVLRLK